MLGKFTERNDTPAASASPGTRVHSWSWYGSNGYGSMRPTLFECRMYRSGKLYAFTRFHVGLPQRLVRFDSSVDVIGVMPRCLEFSGWVYARSFSSVHEPPATLVVCQ